jgi:hypothetical protein
MRSVVAGLVLLALACGCSKPKSSGDEGATPIAPSGGLAFLKGFEGEIDAVVKDSKPGETPTSLEVFVKGDKLRLDLPAKIAQGSANFLGPGAYVIFDSTAKKLSVVSDAQKQAIVVDLNTSGEQLKGLKGIGGPASPAGGAPQGPTTKLTKTGRFDSVAGYKCENWDVTSDHHEATICVAQEGVSWFSIPMTGIPTERLWMAELVDGKHFPLRLVTYAKDGATEENRIEVTRIDKKTLAASQFEYPASYRVVDLAQMFHGLAAMAGSGMPMTIPLPRGKAH